MTEKYKVYIPEDMKNRLMNDAELFEFVKADGSVNLNAFLKSLLVSYFDLYRERKDRLWNTILADLESFSSISRKEAHILTDRIINTYMQEDQENLKCNAVITLTVSGPSLSIIQTVENNLLKDTSLSQYLKDLFLSYLSNSRSDRERIVFHETFEDLEEAIQKKRPITFSTSSSDPGIVFEANPYLIATSKEEQCNYLLCYDTITDHPRSFRISRIRTVFMKSEQFKPSKKIMKELQEAALRNPHSASKNVQATVCMTEKGKKKFLMVTKNRPDVIKKDGNLYYFNWPLRQLEEYFKRFGKDAVILDPESSRESMKIFYGRALDAYKQ